MLLWEGRTSASKLPLEDADRAYVQGLRDVRRVPLEDENVGVAVIRTAFDD